MVFVPCEPPGQCERHSPFSQGASGLQPPNLENSKINGEGAATALTEHMFHAHNQMIETQPVPLENLKTKGKDQIGTWVAELVPAETQEHLGGHGGV